MKASVLAVAAILALPCVGKAQQPPASSPEALKLAHAMLEKTMGNKDEVVQAMSQPMVGMMQQIGVQDPAKAQVIVKEVVLPLMNEHLDELFNLQAELYARTLSIADMKGAMVYYDSPAGRDWIAAQPQLAKGQLASTTQWITEMRPEMIQRIQKLINDRGWQK